MNTTKRFPRSTREAFKDADYASSLEVYRRDVFHDRVVGWACGVAFVCLLVILAKWG